MSFIYSALFLRCLLYMFLAVQVFGIIVYFPRIIMWFQGFKKQKRLINPIKNNFALIIPARNESKVIGGLIESINKQTYDKKYFDSIVVVDSEYDKTVEMVKNTLPNSRTIVVKNQTRKAEALDGALKTLLAGDKKYDGYIILDADMVLTENFLEEMNNATITGCEVIIPRKRIKNWETKDKKCRNVISNCSALTYVGVDAMGNKAKCKKGYTLALCGQGMYIKGSIIEELGGYPFRGLIEDYELAIHCLRKGYRQYYYEYAEVFSEEPVKRKEFNKRRVRWIQGFTEFGRNYNKEIAEICKKDKTKAKESLWFRNGIIPVYFLFITAGAFFAIFMILGVLYLLSGNAFSKTAFIYMLIPLLTVIGELMIYGFISVFEDRDVNKMTLLEKIKLVIAYPFITLEYVWIFIYAYASKPSKEWVPVERLNIHV